MLFAYCCISKVLIGLIPGETEKLKISFFRFYQNNKLARRKHNLLHRLHTDHRLPDQYRDHRDLRIVVPSSYKRRSDSGQISRIKYSHIGSAQITSGGEQGIIIISNRSKALSTDFIATCIQIYFNQSGCNRAIISCADNI